MTTDIDIDLADRDAALANLPHVPALARDGSRHPTGVYFQDIPRHPVTGFATLDPARAASFGYCKLDLLNNSIYRGVRDAAHRDALAEREPPWELFGDRDVVDALHHVRGHFDVVAAIAPRSLGDLAVAIALIRPGKRHLLGRSRAEIDADVWRPSRKPQGARNSPSEFAGFAEAADGSTSGARGDGYAFKKSHAYAYALSIVLQLNLMLEAYADGGGPQLPVPEPPGGGAP